MATRANLFVDQGTDFETMVDLEDAVSQPLDLTNISFTGQARKSATALSAYDFTVQEVFGSPGTIKIQMDNSTTGSMAGGRYVYDIFGKDNVIGTEFKVLEGIIEIIPQVTR